MGWLLKITKDSIASIDDEPDYLIYSKYIILCKNLID